MPKDKIACPWCLTGAENMRVYHDEEWGAPRRDDHGQFEFMTLEAAQAGLSWSTILNKRDGYRRAFADFDPEKVARFGPADESRLLADPGIVRNRLKIKAAIGNARLFLELAAKHGSFSRYIWGFVDGKPIRNAWTRQDELPATSPESDAIAKEMKRLGFKFFGSTIVYAHMQATGMVNDHLVSCFRYRQVARK